MSPVQRAVQISEYGHHAVQAKPYVRREEPEKEDELAPEVPTSFATKGVGWSGREKDDLNTVDLNEKEK